MYFAGSKYSILATTSPRAPWPTSAPELGAATRNDASPNSGSREVGDAVEPSSVNYAIQENTVAVLGLLPRPLPTAHEIALTGPLRRERTPGLIILLTVRPANMTSF